MKLIIHILIILAVIVTFALFINDNCTTHCNEGKRALIHGKDTCYIRLTDKDGYLHIGTVNQYVKYQDRNGVWHDETFNSKDIRIIK